MREDSPQLDECLFYDESDFFECSPRDVGWRSRRSILKVLNKFHMYRSRSRNNRITEIIDTK